MPPSLQHRGSDRERGMDRDDHNRPHRPGTDLDDQHRGSSGSSTRPGGTDLDDPRGGSDRLTVVRPDAGKSIACLADENLKPGSGDTADELGALPMTISGTAPMPSVKFCGYRRKNGLIVQVHDDLMNTVLITAMLQRLVKDEGVAPRRQAPTGNSAPLLLTGAR